jgi:hypothetical protein
MLTEDKIRKIMGLWVCFMIGTVKEKVLNNIQKCQRNWDYSKFNIKNQVHREYG